MTRAARPLAAAVLVVALSGAGAAVPAAGTAPSITTLSVQAAAAYGQPVTTAARVVVPGAAADGWVYFVVDGVARRTDVAPDGTATTTVEGLRTGTHRLTATFVPRDPFQQQGSTSAETQVVVHRVVPRAILRVTGRRADRVLRVRVRLRTPYATEPTGRIAVTLRRTEAGAPKTRQALLDEGTARLTFGRSVAGRHRVVLRYRGDAGTEPVRDVRDVRVRRARR